MEDSGLERVVLHKLTRPSQHSQEDRVYVATAVATWHSPSSPHSHPIFPNIPKVKLVDLIVGAPQTMSATSRSHVATAVAT